MSPLHVLIVDDEPLIRWAIAQTLTGAGYVTLEAGTARDAIDVASKEPRIDVIVLDYRLPDCTDWRLLGVLRNMAPNAATIVMSNYVDIPEFASLALRWGADRIVSKPFEMSALRLIVDNLNGYQRVWRFRKAPYHTYRMPTLFENSWECGESTEITLRVVVTREVEQLQAKVHFPAERVERLERGHIYGEVRRESLAVETLIDVREATHDSTVVATMLPKLGRIRGESSGRPRTTGMR